MASICVASNREGIKKMIVKAKGDIQYKKSSINNTVVYTNETVTCEADGSPTPYVAWVRLGVVLVNKKSTAEITITENNGEYVCVASDREGIKKLIVKAKAPLQLCHDHLIITDVSRAVNHIFQSSQVKSDVSDIDLSKWYRIQSPAGNQLPTTCVPQNRCGTQAPGWLNGTLPSVQDGIVKKTVCFHFNGDCCYQNATVHIRKCFGFYVYKFSAVPKQLPAPRHCIQNEHIDTRDCPYFTFATSENSREGLVGHVMYSEAEVQKDLICLNYCIILNDCKSFNYSKEKKICEINNATRQEYPEAFVKNDAFAYYEKMFTSFN
ncbi:uncharacterized protein LOC116290808 [Actinia tenebrosa]|uniref:Uncharacterized protein LOC116290808 n=1 Tax=Actinia tenebrosa TaxID=6105 RepID=A0A6P8HFL2_ACTTE|nr:uncharacterized protein LOC116290808 [Actinia tenebrosa]